MVMMDSHFDMHLSLGITFLGQKNCVYIREHACVCFEGGDTETRPMCCTKLIFIQIQINYHYKHGGIQKLLLSTVFSVLQSRIIFCFLQLKKCILICTTFIFYSCVLLLSWDLDLFETQRRKEEGRERRRERKRGRQKETEKEGGKDSIN